MEVYIKLMKKNSLPTIDTLTKAMWFENASISKAGNDEYLNTRDEVSLSWDKWINDERWTEHSKSKEYIYFQLIQSRVMKIEVDDAATFVDKRAVYLAAKLLAEKTEGEIKIDDNKWLSIEEFIDIRKNYINCSIDNAIEISLNE
jgi:hypothetical protein